MISLIKNKVNTIINDLQANSKTLIVLKGISLELFDQNKPKLERVLNNYLMYILEITNSRKVITYDEFIYLYDSILKMYDQIYIIDNNIFLNFYPLNVEIEERELKCLLNHFDSDNIEYTDNELIPRDINEYTEIYGNIIKRKDNYFVVYNEGLSNSKIKVINLWKNIDEDINEDNIFSNKKDVIEIIDEFDYMDLINDLHTNPNKLVKVVCNFKSTEGYAIRNRLVCLNNYFKDILKFKFGKYNKYEKESYDYTSYLDILKTYWNKDKFLTIKTYDINELENNIKKINEISQGDIIHTIVEQSLKAYNNENFSDIFVTAPTGSGKSAMFQIPAIYLSELPNIEESLLTIVISPLIGLMKDQVKNLQIKNYEFARTINSDISPIKKQEIVNDVQEGKCNILYISPETLLSRSDIEQLIGNRKIGLFVIDEAHIVTTWGKQFRPDYWFLGERIKQIRKKQIEKHGLGFPIATFTATAIYGGVENMYLETIMSLHMVGVENHTYLGYIKREDIDINIDITPKITKKIEYEQGKFDQLIKKIKEAVIFDKKMLIYFPTVELINRFNTYCYVNGISNLVAKYHGQMDKSEKDNNYEKFYNKEKLVMLATKAFGMGIDIDDIEIVVHFAPTGNVCDYVQEIGRVARNPKLRGQAYYNHMSNDFKHINRLHGMSMIQEYQLVQVIKKIYELYQKKIEINSNNFTRKRRAMLIDAQSFSHIFNSSYNSEDESINKVKTALLIIQKDFEKLGFAPFHIRPIPLFGEGFFKIDKNIEKKFNKKYKNTLEVINKEKEVYSVNLQKIWENSFSNKFSFPQFKYLIYSKSDELKFEFKNEIIPALILDIFMDKDYKDKYNYIIGGIKEIINTGVREDRYYSIEELISTLCKQIKISEYKAKSIMDIIVTTMTIYKKNYTKHMNSSILTVKPLKNGEVKYRFNNSVFEFFKWIDKNLAFIEKNLKDNKIYLINENGYNKQKEFLMVLGILEIMEIISFNALGGRNSQIYMYINETKRMKNIIKKPYTYKNRLLETVNKRHRLSVEMLAYLFQNNLISEEIWDCIEDYFLGIIPEKVKKSYYKKYKETVEDIM